MSHTDGGRIEPQGRPHYQLRPRILLGVPGSQYDAFFPPETLAALNALGEVSRVEPARLQSRTTFQEVVHGVQIFVTAWGVPRLDAARLASLPDLRLVMHAASSLHGLVSEDFWAAGVPVSQAGSAMAPAVAELSLSFTLSLLRNVHRYDHALRSGADWEQARQAPRAREMRGARISVVGASRTGREYLALCRALGADVRVYDPYLAAPDPLAALALPLTEALEWADVVAVHAPATPETHRMLGAAELAAIHDGGILVNTARSSIIDTDALFQEVCSGRLDAALDVFDDEPLPLDDRWRALPNVLLTPHLGGASAESRKRAGQIVVDEIRRHLAGEPLQHALTRQGLGRMA